RNPSGINLSIGAIGLLFALLSVRLRAVYWVKYLWALVVIVIGALVLLRVPALQEAASRIPRFHEAQQARALFLCVFAFAGLAAIRLDWTIQKETLDVERVFGLVVALFLAVTVGGLLVLRDADVRDDLGLADRIVGENWQAAILVGSAAVVAALFWMGSGAVRWLVLPLAVIELSIPAVLGLPVSDKPPAILSDALPDARAPQLRAKGSSEAFLPNALLARRVRDVNGTEVPIPSAYESYMEYVEYGGAGGFGRGVHVTKASHPLLALAGVEYSYAGGWRYVGDDGTPVRARRAYYANVAIVGVGLSDSERLARLEEALAGTSGAVLVDHDVATGPLEQESGAIEFRRDDAERVEIRTHAGAARLLVLADTWAPGWTATVDGQEAPIHRVNLWMRGVAVPAGEHDVRFSYRPAWVERGLLASGIGALCVVVLWLFALRRPVVQPIG
ncbi:MAG: YfhO family protein, partial [Planctomycetota bacterium]